MSTARVSSRVVLNKFARHCVVEQKGEDKSVARESSAVLIQEEKQHCKKLSIPWRFFVVCQIEGRDDTS